MNAVLPTLLLIPSMQQSESLRAFMYRTAQANAFPRMYTEGTLRLMSRFLNEIDGKDPMLGQELRGRLAPTALNAMKASTFSLGADALPASCLRIGARSVCPICLAVTPWSLCEWELKAYTTCHIHGVKLIDECDQCGKKFTWDRTELLSCYCGRLLCAVEPKPAQPWERNWATRLHYAIQFSMGGSTDRASKRSAIPMPLSKILLLADVILAVMIPRQMVRCRSNQDPLRLAARMLNDSTYRLHLWETIFLYAAETPLLLNKKLLPGQSLDDIQQNYKGLADDLPVPLHLKSRNFFRDVDWFYTVHGADSPVDTKTHVARLRRMYGPRPDEDFDPFTMSRAAQRKGRE